MDRFRPAQNRQWARRRSPALLSGRGQQLNPPQRHTLMHSTVSFLRAIGTGGLFAAVALSVLAEEDSPSEWNHFGLDFRMGFNIQAKFTGPFILAAPPSAAAAANRGYSDGFVNVD